MSSRTRDRMHVAGRLVAAAILGLGLTARAQAQNYLPFHNGSETIVSFPGSSSSQNLPNFYYRCFPSDVLYGPATQGANPQIEIVGAQWGISQNNASTPIGTPLLAFVNDPSDACFLSAALGLPPGPLTTQDVLGASNTIAALSFYTPFPSTYPVAVWLTFSLASAVGMPPPGASAQAATLLDVEGDNDLDAWIGQGNLEQDQLFLNGGAATFADGSNRLGGVATDALAAAAIDVEGDADPDLLIGTDRKGPRLFLNDGAGNFVEDTANVEFNPDETRGIAIADLDGDADLDAVFANNGQQLRRVINTGPGTLDSRLLEGSGAPNRNAWDAALADVDGDTDLDVLVGASGEPDLFFTNNGNGQFTDPSDPNVPDDVDATHSVRLGDVDGDLDLDYVAGNFQGANQLYLNDGTTVFVNATAGRLPGGSDATVGIELLDVEGDLDLDLWVVNQNEADRLLLNDGTGVFTEAMGQMPGTIDDTRDAAFGDLDGDLDVDALLPVFGFVGDQVASRVVLSDGAGGYQNGPAGTFPPLRTPGGSLILMVSDPTNTTTFNQQYLLASTDETGTASISYAKLNSTLGSAIQLNPARELDLIPILDEPMAMPERTVLAPGVFDEGGRSGYAVPVGPNQELRFRVMDADATGSGAFPVMFLNLVQGTSADCHVPGFTLFGKHVPVNLDAATLLFLTIGYAGTAYGGSGGAIWNPGVGSFPDGQSTTPPIVVNFPGLVNRQLCYAALSFDPGAGPPAVAVSNGGRLVFQ